MSIFDLSKKPPELSRDWTIFQQFIGNIGAFTYIAKERTAYLDDAACRMLECPRTQLNEFEFFNLLEKISKSPVEGQKHIYRFSNNNTTKYIKMNIYESSDEWLGFIQDFTRQISDEQEKNFVAYDPVTHLPSYPSFAERVKKILPDLQSCCLATLYINGIEKLGSFLTMDSTNCCIASVAEILKSYASEKVLIGYKSNYELFAFFMDCDRMFIYNILNSMNESVQNCIPTDNFGEIIDISDKSKLTLSIGCSSYPSEASDFNMLVNYSEFALYEARTDQRHFINWFSEENYINEKDAYRNAQAFNRMVTENQLTYYVQPIVETTTGNIVAYEALMRTVGEIRMEPKQILSIAASQNSLYAIEKLTFFNTMKLLSENQHVFKDKKLFINSMSDYLLTEEDFNELYLTYGELFEKTVIEVVEDSDATPEALETIKKRLSFTHAQLAIDDYGTGYSNSSNLLKYRPDYVKIDHSLISDIHNDLKKQQLVTQIIEFCRDNHLKSLAEGVETSHEMKTVIRLGVDLIQGYYTSKPKPLFLESISKDIKDEIIGINLEMRPGGSKKVYVAQNDIEIDLLKLALEKYTDIHVYQSKLTISGDPDKPVKMNISVMDNHSCELTLKNVNIVSGNSKPTISVGEYARLVLNVSKKNKLGYAGIYVPMGSQFELCGKGSLIIDCNASNGIGIGNDYDHGYGDIIVNMQGSLEVICNSVETVCIGGGYNDDDAEIKLLSGDIKVYMYSHNGLAVGSFNGDANIEIGDNCKLSVTVSGIKVTGIGSCKGTSTIASSADIKISCTGAQAVGIGVLEEGDGSVLVRGGKIDIKMRSARQSCIGTIGGNLNTKIMNTSVIIDSEGDFATGIGDSQGSGNVFIMNSELNINMLCGNPNDINSASGDVCIQNSEINSLVNNKRIEH